MDMISKLPPGIIETILCLLPIQEAARTSILCKEWRYHWIKIPKLAFIEDTFQVSTQSDILIMEQTGDPPSQSIKTITKRSKIFNAIHQVLLMHEGPIDEFALSLYEFNSYIEFDPILFHLSRKNTLKKLSLAMIPVYKLPLSFFSLSNLTELNLSSCALEHEPTFNGFGSLTTLFVRELETSEKTLMHFLSSCPLLKTVNLSSNCATIDYSGDSTIDDLFKCLPLVENLTICLLIVQCFVQDNVSVRYRVPKVLITPLLHLRYLFLDTVAFIYIYALPFLFLLIKSSPNLEKLKLELFDDSCLEEFEIGSFTPNDYSDIWLEHLKELEILNFSKQEIALDFVKLFFAKSPVLKKVKIYLCNEVAKDEKFEISRILLHSRRASPGVQIIISDMKN